MRGVEGVRVGVGVGLCVRTRHDWAGSGHCLGGSPASPSICPLSGAVGFLQRKILESPAWVKTCLLEVSNPNSPGTGLLPFRCGRARPLEIE